MSHDDNYSLLSPVHMAYFRHLCIGCVWGGYMPIYTHGDAGGECCVSCSIILPYFCHGFLLKLELGWKWASTVTVLHLVFHSKEVTGVLNHAWLSCGSSEFTLKSSCLCRKTLTTVPSHQLPLKLFQPSLLRLSALISEFNRQLPILKLTPVLPTCPIYTYESPQLV